MNLAKSVMNLAKSVINMTIYEQMLGYIRREPFVVCRIKRVKI